MSEVKAVQPIDEKTKWREDFPVDEVKEHYVERREFTKFLLLISGSFVVGQAYIGVQNFLRKSTQLPPLKKIATLDSLKVDEYLTFEYPEKGDYCYLIRLSKTKFVAYSNKCTHLMCPVIPKMKDRQMYCPCHAGYFDMNNGNPLAGPPPRALARVKLKFIQGDIYAEGMIV